MKKIFQQGDRVTWRDASGERQRGHVLQHSHPGHDGADPPERVHVMREGTSQVTILPPSALSLTD